MDHNIYLSVLVYNLYLRHSINSRALGVYAKPFNAAFTTVLGVYHRIFRTTFVTKLGQSCSTSDIIASNAYTAFLF